MGEKWRKVDRDDYLSFRLGDTEGHWASVSSHNGRTWIAIVREWQPCKTPGHKSWRRYGPQGGFTSVFEAQRWCEGLMAGFKPIQIAMEV